MAEKEDLATTEGRRLFGILLKEDGALNKDELGAAFGFMATAIIFSTELMAESVQKGEPVDADRFLEYLGPETLCSILDIVHRDN